MASSINAAPMTVYNGLIDDSKAQVVVPAIQTATHFPLHWLYTPWGPTDKPVAISSASLNTIFQASGITPRSPYFSTQYLYMQNALKGGNQVMVRRLVPADVGPKARLLLSLDIVADQVTQYVRNADGSFQLDAQGNKVAVTGDGATLPGYTAKWVLNNWIATGENAEAFGQVAVRAGSITSSTGVQSQVYPVLELEATFLGSFGNNLGIRLQAMNANSSVPLDQAQAERILSSMLAMQMVSRTSATATASVTANLNGAQWTQFSLKPDAWDDEYEQALNFTTVIAEDYSARVSGTVPTYGPFESQHVYQSNLEELLAMVGAAEAPQGTLPVATMTASSPDLYTVDLFGATSFAGVPYYTYNLQGAAAGGVVFSGKSTLWASGASDGTMSPTTYDTDVASAAAAFDMLDMSRAPFSIIYDSGYSLSTKKALVPILGLRPDVNLVLSTQSVLDPQNTEDEDESVGLALNALLATYPESVLEGTSVCRAMVQRSSGYILNNSYKGIIPTTYHTIGSFAAEMGGANGVWDTSVPADQNPQNVMSDLYNVNGTDLSSTVRTSDWASGIAYVESFDMEQNYIPAYASVYNNDTSILKAFINVIIATDLVRIANSIRKTMSGISGLTDDVFAARCTAAFQAAVKPRYGGRVQIRASTIYTTLDTQQGYSWTMKIDMYGNVMKTVGNVVITTHRMSSLPTVTSASTTS